MGVTDGFFNRLRFGWMGKIVKEGRAGEIALENLPLPEEQTSDFAYSQFQGKWEAACKGGKPNLRSVLFQTFGRDLMKAGFFKLGWSVCVIMGAFFFTRSLLMFVNGQEPFAAEWKGWILCVFFFVDAWLLGKHFTATYTIAMVKSAALQLQIISKCLRCAFYLHVLRYSFCSSSENVRQLQEKLDPYCATVPMNRTSVHS
jgi:hypothetical protein